MKTVSAEKFSEAMGIGIRAAQIAFQNASENKCWKGFDLPVVQLPGHRGGKGGAVWALAVDRCSPELQAKLMAVEHALEEPVKGELKGRVDDRHIEVAQDKARIIAPCLAKPKGSRARGQAIRELAAQPAHKVGGEWAPVSERTLREWIAAGEKSLAELLPRSRSDRGQRRVLITREWDNQIDLPEDQRQSIANSIAKTARSMVANDGTSEREVRRICEFRLARACAAAGSRLPLARLRHICKLNGKWSARQELSRYLLIYLKNKDHKGFQDKVVARITRDLHPVPMGLLIGDVHYVDLLVEEDGEPTRVRLIHWMDASSLFVWTTPVFLSKGKGATQEDVAESLSQVAFCPHGGIPQQYYLDNGSEYGALAAAMIRFSLLANMEFGVTLAEPYSPTSKGDIEGHFHILEDIFKGLPGWIGGDRTNKKTQNKGQVIEPYRKGLKALEADIQAAVSIYNNRPQSGRLEGRSPLEMLEEKIAETGFVARVPNAEAFDLIFSKSMTRKIRQGVIEFDGRDWHTTAIDGLAPGTTVEILTPLRKCHDRIFVRNGVGEPAIAEPLPVFQHGDREGARFQKRLEKGQRDAIKKLEDQIDPTVSTFELQKETVARTAPNAPAPESWMRAIDKTLVPISDAQREAEEDAAARDFLDEYLAGSRPRKREADGGTRQTSLNAT